MTVSRTIVLGFAVVLWDGALFAQGAGGSVGREPTAEEIMARVASNQDRAEAERGRYVYVQHARVMSRKRKTVMCEEVTDSRVTPTASGSHAELLKLQGRMLVKHRYISYDALPAPKEDGATAVRNEDGSGSVEVGDDSMDRGLVEQMRADLTANKSKDGIDPRLFPLTSGGQSEMLFQLIGREHRDGREVFHIAFRPKDKDEFGWKGEAYIDTTVYEPVLVSTAMARKIPLAVRTLLGTSVPGLGFTVVYAPQGDGVWFPVSLGTEFKLHVLFFFSREIVIDAENREFEKTHASATMVPEDGAVRP
jgi:hypothetical protein